MAKKMPNRRHLEMLRGELTKVRCWVSGFKEARRTSGGLYPSVPGDDGIRQTIILLDELLGASTNAE